MLAALAPKYDHEIVFVNDGSSDRTLEMLAALARQDEHVRVVSFSRNFGHQSAITAGLDLASGDVAAIIDSDLQDPPEVIPEMIAKWEEGFKVVMASQRAARGEQVQARHGKHLLSPAAESQRYEVAARCRGFPPIDRAVIDAIKQCARNTATCGGMMAWVGFPQFGLKYQRDRRFAGETKYTMTKMVRLALNAILSFSAKPLISPFTWGSWSPFSRWR